MILTIHQPEYLPWLGYFNKLMHADVYVALDNVQYRHKYFQNRNRIPTSNGECWLTVPIHKKGSRNLCIKDIKISNNTTWSRKTWKTLCLTYRKAPYFNQYFDFFEEVYTKEWSSLSNLNLFVIENMCEFLDIKIKIIRASSFVANGSGPSLILDICKELKPEIYISGKSGIAGRGPEDTGFATEGIQVLYQDFAHSQYTQLVSPFISNMSAVDLLFNEGPNSINILKNDGGWYNG
tara:strand:- start:285 stop:992 length:708 start_codon:yes stop_codon:yes gene_type:complete